MATFDPKEQARMRRPFFENAMDASLPMPMPAPDPTQPQPPPPSPGTPAPATSVQPGSLAAAYQQSAPTASISSPPNESPLPAPQTKVVAPAGPLPAFSGPHAGLRRGLASVFAGVADAGAALNYRQGPGAEMVKSWSEQDRAAAEGQRNQPYVQQQAEIANQKAQAEIDETRARTNWSKVQADLAALNLPLQEKAETLYNHLRDVWVNKAAPDWDKYAQVTLAGVPPAIARMVTGHLAEIKQLQQTGKGYALTMQDDLPRSVNVYGKELQRNDPNLPPGAGEEFDQALAAHKTKRQEKVADEATVAGYAAARQGAQINAAIEGAQRAEANKTLNTGREQALKHLNDMRAAQNQRELVEQLASSKSPTDQTSLAFKALGLDLPDGVHRINDTELNAIRNQGGLSDRAYRAVLNWTSGQTFAPEILEDIKGTATKIAQSKIKNANDNLEDVNRVYGYKVPGSGGKGRLDEAPEAAAPAAAEPTAVGKDGHKIAFRGGKWVDAQTGKAVQ